MNHTVEVDQKTFASARKLMSTTQLESVRLTRCKVLFDISELPSETSKISVDVSAKSDGRKISATHLELYFDFRIAGMRGPEGEQHKDVDVSLRLVAVYSLPQDLATTQFEIRAFAGTNGLLNVWPYFREFVQSMTARGGMPPLTVPLFRIQYKTSSEKRTS